MNVNGKGYTAVWMEDTTVFMIDQNKLPFSFEVVTMRNYLETCKAIEEMVTRGAGCIGVAGGFAMLQAVHEAPDNSKDFLKRAKERIDNTRPTAQNLFYATAKVFEAANISLCKAKQVAYEIFYSCIEEGRKIGEYGNSLIQDGFNIETHCNAGWLGLVEYGSALSPIYAATRDGKKIHVFVDETRPRNQGARLTAWELKNEKVPFTIIADNAGAFFMNRGEVDMMIVGADRIAANGDTANKIGTLEKAIVANYYGIPFYVAAPTATFDLACKTGDNIPIEFRNEEEIHWSKGLDKSGNSVESRLTCPDTKAINPAFDVTPASLITGIITEKGIVKPTVEEILKIVTE